MAGDKKGAGAAKPVTKSLSLFTTQEIQRWRERLKNENYEAVKQAVHEATTRDLYKKNDYFYMHRKEDSWVPQAVKGGYDQLKETRGHDIRTTRDTIFPIAVEKRKHGFTTRQPIITSQEYGWRSTEPIDKFKTPFGRSSTTEAQFMDRGHLGA